MTTCPRCGRVADDEIVCPDCGMSLALVRRTSQTAVTADLTDALGFDEEEPPSGPDARVWRLAALVLICCLFAAAAAFLLLHQHGSGGNDTALPFTTHSAAGPSGSGPSPSAGVTEPAGRSSTTPSSATPTASQSRTRPHSSATTSPSAPRSSSPRTSLASATRTVRISKGPLDQSCGPHCYVLVVSLNAFPGGSHHVTCFAQHGGQFGSYTTTATTSGGCEYRRPHDSVWVVVDGTYRSNTIAW